MNAIHCEVCQREHEWPDCWRPPCCHDCGTAPDIQTSSLLEDEGDDRWWCATCTEHLFVQGFIWCQGCEEHHEPPAHCTDCGSPVGASRTAEVLEDRPWFCEPCRDRAFRQMFDLIVVGGTP